MSTQEHIRNTLGTPQRTFENVGPVRVKRAEEEEEEKKRGKNK
jgi:hypothetical protein